MDGILVLALGLSEFSLVYGGVAARNLVEEHFIEVRQKYYFKYCDEKKFKTIKHMEKNRSDATAKFMERADTGLREHAA